MYLNKAKKGFGYYTTVESKDLGGNITKGYLNFQFKKGCEPEEKELNKFGSYEGELWFKDSNGRFRKVFPIAQSYNGNTTVKLVLMDWQFDTNEVKKQEAVKPDGEKMDSSNFGGTQPTVNGVEFDQEELPFY